MVADQTIRDADANAQGSTTMADLMAGLPPLLLGTYTPKIDAKGRVALPAKFRSQLGHCSKVSALASINNDCSPLYS